MIPSRTIASKREGHALEPAELEAFLHGYLSGEVREYQMAAFLMAVHFRGLDARELAHLTRVMIESGERLDLSRVGAPRVDKHSTGGVGDKVSLVLAPLAASLGIKVPMMSGRGLGHTGGTLDKLEAIPGFRTSISLDRFEEILGDVGCAMIGQTEEIAPLDRRLYDLRNVTATVPAIPLIAASIMSKKIAEDLTGLVLDVKVGEGAFIPEEERALELARTMVGLGASHGVPTVALLTAMDRPLGRAVGNALETAEALACLRGNGPLDLRELVIALAVEMAAVSGAAGPPESWRARAAGALDDGSALERFGRLVEEQGGDPRVLEEPGRLPSAAVTRPVRAPRSGRVRRIRPGVLGWGVVELGGGRRALGDDLDPSVGFVLDVDVGDPVAQGDRLGTVHAASESDAVLGVATLEEAVEVGEEPMEDPRPLVSHRVTEGGVEKTG
jgi:pyrimidine-nucleoside phosphorylase